jgi:hypothetical protein
MATVRRGHTATLLPNGKVLVAGGEEGTPAPLASAELFDPSTGNWTATGAMAGLRYGHVAALLPTGKVLVAGGSSADGELAISAAELYDPASGTWSNAAPMSIARYRPQYASLANGKVLVTGGITGETDHAPIASAEIYDPATNSWSSVGAMTTARGEHTMTVLPNGSVLVAGGLGPPAAPLSSAEILPSSPPDAPTGPTANAGLASATVSFSPPVEDGHSSITAYTVTATPGGGHATVPGTGRSATVAGLTAGVSYTFTVTATNALGTSPPSSPSNAVIALGPSPSITAFTLSHKRFRVGSASTVVAARKRSPVGTSFRYTVSQAGTVSVRIVQLKPGRLSGGKCRAPSKKLARKRRCTRKLLKGTLTRNALAGANRTPFSGRIGRRALRPGSYRALVAEVAPNTVGPSATRTAKFTIVVR